MACLVVNLSKQEQRVIEAPLLLDFKLYIDNECKWLTVSCFKSCIQWPRTNGQVNSWHHSATWWMAVLMCHTELGPTVMGGAQPSWIQPRLTTIIFSHVWTINETPWRQYIHIQWWYAGDCGIVNLICGLGSMHPKEFTTVGICQHVCVCVCVTLPKCLWWFFSHIHYLHLWVSPDKFQLYMSHINHRYGNWQGGMRLRI